MNNVNTREMVSSVMNVLSRFNTTRQSVSFTLSVQSLMLNNLFYEVIVLVIIDARIFIQFVVKTINTQFG